MIDFGFFSLNEAYARQERFRSEAERDNLLRQARPSKFAPLKGKPQGKRPNPQLRRGHA
jgi:hypothetical protein